MNINLINKKGCPFETHSFAFPLIMFTTSFESGIIYNPEGVSKSESFKTKYEIERQKPKAFEH